LLFNFFAFFLILDECDPSKWLAFLSEGKVGTSATGEVMWLLDLSEPALTHQGTVPPCFNMYITCVAATGLRAFDRLLLVIWKSGRTCWSSVTVLLQYSSKSSAHALASKLSERFYLFIVHW